MVSIGPDLANLANLFIVIVSIGPDLANFFALRLRLFSYIALNICFECSKELSH